MARASDEERARLLKEHDARRRGIEAALVRARRRALEEGRAAGVPIVYMKDGKMVWDDGADDS